MATQTASPPPAPSAQVIGNAFVEQYYHILHHSPELVYRFYQDTSVLSRPDPNGIMTTVTTMKSINDKICSLDYKSYKAEINTADAQDSFEEGVIVLVTGCLTGKEDNLRRKFTQTFFLAPQDKGYYVLNDVFRYLEDSTSDVVAEVAAVADDAPSSTLTQDQEAQVIDPPKPENATSQGIKTTEEKENDQVINEKPASHPRDIVVEAESLLNENHASVAEEPIITSANQEDAPKKSYASIVSSQTKKRPAKVYVPTSTARVESAKTEKQSINPVAEASVPEASEHQETVHALESDDAQDEVEGHSIYIRNLPLNVTVAQLEEEFAKFGPIKPNGVQVRGNKVGQTPQGFCFGFVEFQEFSSMQSAIKASPVTIGDRQATVEIKRTTTRVGGGRGRFSYSRGVFRNESFRGRGNFSGGRTYVRSDSIRGRGNSSSGRGGGEGYQQGRGRGSRRPGPTQNVGST